MGDKKKKPKRPTCNVEVVRTQRLTPHMRRITLGGDGLRPYVDNGFTDRYVKLVFPRPGVDHPGPLDLDDMRATLPKEQWPVTRTYTIRSYDKAALEISIDFVLHGDEGIAGPWAARAEPGDRLSFRGPGGAYRPDPEADWHLMVGDESALPAIGSALEELPTGVPVYAFVEVENAEEEQPLVTNGKLEVVWIHRESSPHPAGVELVDTVKAFQWPEGTVQAFVHGEAGFFKELRRHLRKERPIPKDLLSISGYWKRGKNEDGWQSEKAQEARLEQERLDTQSGDRLP